MLLEIHKNIFAIDYVCDTDRYLIEAPFTFERLKVKGEATLSSPFLDPQGEASDIPELLRIHS